MTTDLTGKNTTPVTLADLVARESETEARNLAVRTGVRAGTGDGKWGKFAKFA